MDPPKALAILRAVAGQADLQLTAQSPSLDAELRPWGARVKAAIPPITKAPVFTIRKPPGRVFTLDEYVEAGILTAAQADVLRAAVAAKQNILVSGATYSVSRSMYSWWTYIPSSTSGLFSVTPR